MKTGTLNRKILYPAVLLFVIVLGGYSIAARFAGLIGASRTDKVNMLVLTAAGVGLVWFSISRLVIKRINFRFKNINLWQLILVNFFLAGLVILFIFSPPPFPESHNLQVTPLGTQNPLSDGEWVNVLSIERVNLPGKTAVPVYPEELEKSGSWRENPNQALLWQGGEAGPLAFSSFFQGGINLQFETGPARGKVRVIWDGTPQNIDLYNPITAERTVWLAPPLSLQQADRLRQAMVIAAQAGEWLLLGCLLLFIEWAIAAFFSRYRKLTHVRLMVGGLGVFALGFLLSSYLAQPVTFPDPQLERIIRKTLNNDEKPIFQHQLLKIARLDASGRGIRNLEGIEYLRNLVELDLRENMIGNITPLGDFDRLQSLNLRGNQVQDLSPLAQVTTLHYLNLHSNYHISSIEPLENLANLEKLILANVPVGSQGSYLGNLTGLKELNLRGTGLSDAAFLAGLDKLEYLNLHSNPGLGDISALASLDKLHTLILQDTPVGSQVEILRNLNHLTRLNLRNTKITDLTALADLMERGILQDNPASGLAASLDISSNPIISKDFAVLKPYWINIASRVPFNLPENTPLESPAFSHAAGFYRHGFFLEMETSQPGTTIHYTLDGSDPTASSPVYTQPISIDSREGDSPRLSRIEDTSLEWKPPLGEVYQATVVRARTFDSSGGQSSPIQTATYFVDEDMSSRFSLPVISLVTDNSNLFDPQSGIYVAGEAYQRWRQLHGINPRLELDANYLRHGAEWERPVHIEFFEQNGLPGFSSDNALRIHGNSTREFPQKSLRIIAQTEEGNLSAWKYEIFPGLTDQADNQPITEFSSIILQNFGNDWKKALIRDPLLHNLVEHTNVDTLASRPAVVFLNGEYWGIYNIRQRSDEYYLADTHQVNPEMVVILDDNQILYRGVPGDEQHYRDMLDYISKHDIREQENYKYITDRMDIDSFIDYQIAEIYTANTDWPLSNTRYWRLKEPDPLSRVDDRWRWILYDTDRGFGYDPQYEDYNHRTLEVAENPSQNGFLLNSLLLNDEFQTRFINRWADQLNTTFRPERVINEINSLAATLQPEMQEHIRRWRTMQDSIENWEANIDDLREFASRRPDILRGHLLERFAIEDTFLLTIEADPAMGYVHLSSIDLVSSTPGVDNPASWSGVYFSGIPLQLTAVPYPGYQFLGWEGFEGKDASIMVSLTADMNLKAHFAKP